LQKTRPIRVGAENGASLITTSHDVINRPWILNAQRPSHKPAVA
jgi:hypothetical protein